MISPEDIVASVKRSILDLNSDCYGGYAIEEQHAEERARNIAMWIVCESECALGDPREIEIPELTLGGLGRYIDHGIPPGSFLRAVLEHDLFAAVAAADVHNMAALCAIVVRVYSRAPSMCHGKGGQVERWIEIGGMDGRRR